MNKSGTNDNSDAEYLHFFATPAGTAHAHRTGACRGDDQGRLQPSRSPGWTFSKKT